MGTSGQSTVIMKVFLVLSAALLVSASATTEVGCEDCKALVNSMATWFTNPVSIEKQVMVLLAEVCPGSSNPDGCTEGLPDFWTKIAMILWPGYYNAEESWMCATEEICGAPGAELAMTCDVCTKRIAGAIEQLLSEEFVTGIVERLSGEEFCGVDEDPEMCANVIAQLIPAALPALAAGVPEEVPQEICNVAVPDTCLA